MDGKRKDPLRMGDIGDPRKGRGKTGTVQMGRIQGKDPDEKKKKVRRGRAKVWERFALKSKPPACQALEDGSVAEVREGARSFIVRDS